VKRVNGSGDFGDINIVLKKSTDGGATWSALSTVIDYNNLQAGNPAPVVDLKIRVIRPAVFFYFITRATMTNIRCVWERVFVKYGM